MKKILQSNTIKDNINRLLKNRNWTQAELERKVASNQANNAYQSEMLEIERMKAKAMQDQVNFAKNKDITDTLLGISSNLLSNPNRTAPRSPQMFNCQTRKFGGFDQIQCF